MLQRSLVVLLSTLNLGTALWWAFHRPPEPRAAPLPLGVARLELLSEARRDAAVSATESARPVSGRLPTQCHRFGPFTNPQAAVAAQARLQGLAVQVVSRTEPGLPSQWRVMLPPQASQAEAEAVARRIRAAGFGDLRVLSGGADSHAIALGLYSSEEAATRQADALVRAGFPVRTEPVGAREVMWLEVGATEEFDPVRAQALAGAPERRELDCSALPAP